MANIIEIKVDFRQLLKDISYTNAITKLYDVSEIITRGQYYELKDGLVSWLLEHRFTENTVEGFEYVIDKNGDKVGLVRLTISYGDTICRIHQNNKSKLRRALGIHGSVRGEAEYNPENLEPVEYDELKFRECISRMKVERIRFIREKYNNNVFRSICTMNNKSENPWIQHYLNFLPNKGKNKIKIVDKTSQ